MSATQDWLTPGNRIHTLGMWVLIGSGVAAGAVNGFSGHLDLKSALVIGTVCGIIGGAMFASGRAPFVVGSVCGLVSALGGLTAVYYWTLGRERLAHLEFVVIWMIGAYPGWRVFKFWAQARSDESAPPGDIPPPMIG